MSLFNKIEELQNKPESYRKKVLLVSMIVLMSIVVFIWISTVNLSVGAMDGQNKKSGVEYSPFAALKDGAANIKESFNNAVGQFESGGGTGNEQKNVTSEAVSVGVGEGNTTTTTGEDNLF